MSAVCVACGKPFQGITVAGQCPSCLLVAGFEELDDPLDPDAGSETNADDDQPTLGRVGNYDLIEEIARGGMGIVYRARQITLNREVAIKMILAGHSASSEAVERFLTEARTAAKLDHPNIVPVYEVGELEEDYFFSMKLIEGSNLSQLRSTLSLATIENSHVEAATRQRTIATIVSKIASALDYAHGRGILHRDIKPNNVLVDETGEPLLTDFGLAKLTGKEESGLTLSTSILGSPSYMAPEQAQGSIKQVTTAADVYGIGAVLYELLSGVPPFHGDTALETIQQVIHLEPRPIRELQPLVNRDLEMISLKCLQKEPKERYPSARALEEELGRFLRDEPIAARPVTLLGRTWRWGRRNPLLGALTALVCLAVMAGSAGILWQWKRATQANVELQQSVAHLNWQHITKLLEQDEAERAVARLAQLIRQEPSHWRAATYAMSILNHHTFPLPVSLPLENTGAKHHVPPQLSPDGLTVAMAGENHGLTLYHVDRDPHTLGGNDTPVRALAFHPNQPWLFAGTANGIEGWNLQTNEKLAPSLNIPDHLQQLIICGDGSRLLAAVGEEIQVWRFSSQGIHSNVRQTISCGARIHQIRCNRNGRTILARVASPKSCLRLWQLEEGTALPNVREIPVSQVSHFDLSADGTRIAATTGPFSVEIWKVEDPEFHLTISDHRGTIDAMALTPDGKHVYASGRHGIAHSWDAETGSRLISQLKHHYDIPSIEFDSMGRFATTGSTDYTARIWDVKEGKPFCTRMLHNYKITRATFNSAQTHVLTETGENHEGTLQWWRVPSKDTAPIYSPPDARDMGAVRLSPQERFVAVGSSRQGEYILTVSSVTSGEVVFGPERLPGDVYGAMFTPDESKLIITTANGSIFGWSVETWEPLWESIHLETMIIPATMSPDGQLVATGSQDGWVRLWDVETGSIRHAMLHGGSIRGLSFSHDSRLLVSGSYDKSAVVWNVGFGEKVCRFTGHEDRVLCVSFDHDAKRVVSSSYDATARVWEAATAKELIPPLRHRGELADARFSPDGTRVATGSRDGTMRLWDARTGEPLINPIMHPEPVRTVRFSPDGKRLLSVDHAGPRIWDVETCEPLTIHFDHPIASGLGVDSLSVRASFTADSRRIFLGTSSTQARYWHVPDAPKDIPSWFPSFLEVIAGMRFDPSDRVEVVQPRFSLEMQRMIEDGKESGYYSRWAKAYLRRYH